MDSIQFWLAFAIVEAVLGIGIFYIGCYVGIRSEQHEQRVARAELAVGSQVSFNRK